MGFQISCSQCMGRGTVHCPTCNGTTHQEVHCTVCRGSGVERIRIVDRARYRASAKRVDCRECEGTGRIYQPCDCGSGRVPCVLCEGAGVLDEQWVLTRKARAKKQTEATERPGWRSRYFRRIERARQRWARVPALPAASVGPLSLSARQTSLTMGLIGALAAITLLSPWNPLRASASLLQYLTQSPLASRLLHHSGLSGADWQGTFDHAPAVLVIAQQSGATFRGTLTVERPHRRPLRVSVRGYAQGHQVAMRPLADGSAMLRSLAGFLSTDGRTMQGMSRDASGHLISWRFTPSIPVGARASHPQT